MLRLFQSIFGGVSQDEPYPDELIKRAVERAVDGTDPRLRALPGYSKKLRAAVIHAIDHVVEVVDSFSVPLELSRSSFTSNAESTAYFVSMNHVHEILERDAELKQWLKSPGNTASEHIVMLLLMERQDRQTFGVELEGGVLRNDVAQTTVSFSRHRLLDPAVSEVEMRRQFKRRAFDHLLTLALGRIAEAHTERVGLERERTLLRKKCTALASGHWGFAGTDEDTLPDRDALEQQIEEIESQLNAAGAGPGLLQANLDIVVEVLGHAEKNLWVDSSSLVINRMGVQQSQASVQTPEISLTLLHNAVGRNLVARLLKITRDELPPQRDFLREAQRYLG